MYRKKAFLFDRNKSPKARKHYIYPLFLKCTFRQAHLLPVSATTAALHCCRVVTQYDQNTQKHICSMYIDCMYIKTSTRFVNCPGICVLMSTPHPPTAIKPFRIKHIELLILTLEQNHHQPLWCWWLIRPIQK